MPPVNNIQRPVSLVWVHLCEIAWVYVVLGYNLQGVLLMDESNLNTYLVRE